MQVVHVPIRGALEGLVQTLMAVEIEKTGPIPLAVAPHDAMMLTVQFGRGTDPIERKGEAGTNSALTGIRQWTGSFVGAGDCVTLFALLTPLGATQLLETQPLEAVQRIRAPVAALLEQAPVRALERSLARIGGLEERLQAFAGWLEARAVRPRRLTRAALRAGRAAMRICADPQAAVDDIADEQHVSRRQLERDMARWIGTSPRHLAQVARVQQVSRSARAGASLADAAAHAGFADQAHMSRVVKQMTGLTPATFVRSQRSALAAAFRGATGGATVYL